MVTGSDECQMSPKTSDLFFGMSWSVDTVVIEFWWMCAAGVSQIEVAVPS